MNLNVFDNIDDMYTRELENAMRRSSGAGNSSDANGQTTRLPQKMPLAMAYVPFQQWGEVYDDSEALDRGTLFPELDLPFEKGAGMR